MNDSDNRESKEKARRKISRRRFLKGAGLSGIGAAVASGSGIFGHIAEARLETTHADVLGPGPVPLMLKVNGRSTTTQAEPRATLAEVLRDTLHLTGTKVVCDRGSCGACTVLLDGEPVCSCMVLAIDAAGRGVQTIEGLAEGDRLHPLQEMFIEHDGMQCGFCTPGMIMSAKAVLDRSQHVTPEEVRIGLSGNLCRCGTYPKVIDAVVAAAKRTGKAG